MGSKYKHKNGVLYKLFKIFTTEPIIDHALTYILYNIYIYIYIYIQLQFKENFSELSD